MLDRLPGVGAAAGTGAEEVAGAPATPSTGGPGPADPDVTVTAVGDVVMGATPELPPDDGAHLFDAVADRLTGDVVLANLDQALTDIPTSTEYGAGSSPHVLRGMEWYRGRLIADSLGNVTGCEPLSTTGPSGIGDMLTVSLASDGTWRKAG